AVKKVAERKAMHVLRDMLPSGTGALIYELWEEFESQVTPEAQIANALDKLEAQVQHNEADLTTWLDWEKQHVFGGLNNVTGCYPGLVELKDAIIAEAKQKLRDAGENIENLQEKGSNN